MKRHFLLVIALSLLPPLLLRGQAVIKQHFDATKALTLKGTVVGLALFRDRSYLILDVKDEGNMVQRWAIEGNDRDKLLQAGWKLPASPEDPTAPATPADGGFNRPRVPYRGEMVTVIAYGPRVTTKIEDILGSSPTRIGGVPEGLPADSPVARLAGGPLNVDLVDLFNRGRFAHGTVVTFANADKLAFGATP